MKLRTKKTVLLAIVATSVPSTTRAKMASAGAERRSANVVKRLTARFTKTATSVMAHWFAIKANSLTSVKLMTKALWSVTTPKIRLVASVAASLRPGIVS